MNGIRILRPLFLLLALVTAFASAACTPPRLWEVTGKGADGTVGRFYILAVTHNGLDAEYDDYLMRTVAPIALKADVFFHEASEAAPREYPPCPRPLADTEENRQILRSAYKAVERADYDSTGYASVIPGLSEELNAEVHEALQKHTHADTAALSEYGLIAAMRTYLFNTLTQHPERWPKWLKKRLPIADYLVEQRKSHGKKANESIDAKFDILDAYCSVDGAQRGSYLQRLITKYDPAKFKPVAKEDVAGFDASFVGSLQRGFMAGTLVESTNGEYGAHLVCDRNDKWVETMRQGLGNGIRFYALGVAHVLQSGPENPLRCSGLLARLREDGFSVTIIK